MSKRGVYLYLTVERIEALKQRGVNISQVVDRYLAGLVGGSPGEVIRIPKKIGERKSILERALAREVEKERKAEAIARMEERIKPFRDYYKEKTEGSLKWTRSQRTEWLKHTAKNVGLTVRELLTWLKPKATGSDSAKEVGK